MADAAAPLLNEILRRIAVGGPMPVADYMRLCLTHPEHGYYVKRDPLGSGGDFITAPEISQMFGELIGLWMATVWRQMGAPENFRIVELGPGRGTLLDDALRATKAVPGFRQAAVVHLVEISPALRQVQERRLAKTGMTMLSSGLPINVAKNVHLVYRSQDTNRRAFWRRLSAHLCTHCSSTVWSTHRFTMQRANWSAFGQRSPGRKK